MKNNQIKAGSLLSYAQMALGIVISLVYTPLMIRLLGKNEYGLYNTVSSAISMLSVLSLGFNSGYIRYFAKYKKTDDEGSISRLNGMFLLIFAVIGAAALLCGLYLSFHLEFVFKDGLTLSEMAKARILMILLSVNLAISFPMSVFTNIISAHERFVFLKLLGICKTVLSPLLSLPLLLAGFHSVALVLVTIFLSLVTDTLYLFYVLRVLKCRFLFHGFEKGLFVSLFVYTGFIAINMIVDQINWNIDKVLLGRFRGTAAVAVYSVGYTLYTYYMMLSTSISGMFTPRIHRIIVNHENDRKLLSAELTELFVKVGRIQLLTLGLIACGFIFTGKAFIDFWAGSGYSDAYYVALLLMIPSSVALTQNIGIEIQRAQNRHKFRSLAYSIMAVINLVLSIYLCKLYGAIGSAVGTAVSLILCNGIIMNTYYHRKCNIDIPEFWKNILSVSKGFIPVICFGILLNHLLPESGWVPFLIKIALFSAVYAASVWLLSMNSYEKDLCRKLIGIVFHKSKGKSL